MLGTGESYWLYKNAFDYDSYDNDGSVMRTVNNDPTIACPNANWNGVTTNYCDGVTSDDTVSHEWGHAYTEYTSGLVYQWQSGAMNEAYSDIWGETVDIINSRYQRGAGHTPDRRAVLGFTRADVELNINAPAPIAGHCDAAPAAFGPVIGNPGFTDDVVVGAPLDGCTALTNAAAVNGNFVYVDRGTCSFDIKADFAEAAGATGIIVGQNIAGPPTGMSGSAEHPRADDHPWTRVRRSRPRPGPSTPRCAASAPTCRTTPTGGCPASPTRPSVVRSATCGTRPATATRAR